VCYHFQLKFQCCIEAALLPETVVEKKKNYVIPKCVCVYLRALYMRAIQKLTKGVEC
jgi:hypothetical protein